MSTRIFKFLFIFVAAFFIFQFVSTGTAEAKPNDCGGIQFCLFSACITFNINNHTTVNFTNFNSGTNWQVRAIYYGHNNNGSWWNTGWGFYWTHQSPMRIDCYYPRPGDYVIWQTSCVDPKFAIAANPADLRGTSDGVTLIHRERVNVTCNRALRNSNIRYAACDAPDNKGNVRWDQVCPGTPDCATRGLLDLCNAGTTSCGTGSYRCDRIRETCNFSNSLANWCSSTVVNRDASRCLGVDGCCLQNSDCNGGGTYCGSGNNACTLYRNVCNSNKRCQVNTVSTESLQCARDTYWACTGDAECGSSRFCRNPNPCGICTDYDQINGRVYVDVNRNNSWDSGTDVPLRNASVQRKPTSGTFPSAESSDRWIRTNNNGFFTFNQLKNPPDQDVRIIPFEFGLYDANHCTYTDIIRSKYQGNVQSSPGHRRNNIDPTPNLTGVHFMLRSKQYAIAGTVWRDGNNNGVLDAGDWRLNNSNVRVRTNDSVTGAFIANDNLYAGPDTTRRGNFWITGHVDGRTYDIALAQGTLPAGLFVVGSNRINGVTINCANNGGHTFLVTDLVQPTEPDLTINSFSIDDNTVGANTTANINISNDGNAPTSVDFTVRLRHNNSTTTVNIPTSAIAAGDSRSITRTIPVPSTDGTYTADIFVDSANVVAESDETNNTATTSYEALPPGVTPPPPTGGGTPPPPPPPDVDLDITSFNITDGIPGDPTDGTITVTNNGTGNTLVGFTININNGSGSSINITEEALAGGASTSPIPFVITTPSSAGTYTAVATVDSANAIDESNEGNNTATTAYNAIDLPDIQGGVFEDAMDEFQRSDGIRTAGENYRSGTITISNGIGNFESTSPDGFLAQDLPEAAYTISFDAGDIPQGWQALDLNGDPLLTPPDPFFINITPGSSCDTGTHIHAQCDADGNITDLDFPIRPVPADPWFNGIGGDMRSDPPLVNRIPESADTYFSEIGPNSSAGVVFGSNLTLEPLTTSVTNVTNPNNWLVEESFKGVTRTSYLSIRENLTKGGNLPNTPAAGGSISPGNVSNPIVYDYSSSVVLTGGNFNFTGVGNSYVILVNGDLRIENDITVAQGSTAFFIASGEITIAQNVQNIAGIFSAGTTFTVEGNSGAVADQPLEVQGSIISHSGTFSWDTRDLLIGNENTPSVQIIYRPDFVLSAPELMRFSNYTIREVAPGAE